ncbi:MAG: tetratricopeptide repeat protein [Verrucomicrobiaceae bacterium]|nr:tetratricopeptide repeat protein [Verrucomicrobiaceae bacterium]
MKYFITFLLLLPISIFAEISVSDMFSKPTMNKYEAEIVAKAMKASNVSEECEILLSASKKSWAGAPLLFNLGNAYFRKGDHNEAIKYFELALQKQKFFLAYKNLGFAYYAKNDQQKALDAFARALAISGNSDVQILTWMANHCAKEGDISSALAMCNQALIFSRSDALYYAKIRFMIDLNMLAEAEKLASLQFAKTRNKNYLRLLVKARLAQDDKVGAISALEMLNSCNDIDKSNLELLADLYFSVGAYSKALEFYGKNSSFAKLENLAFACINTNDLKTALKIAKKLETKNVANKIKGIIFARSGDFSKAVLLLRSYLDCNQSDFVAVWELAEALYKNKEYTQSSVMYSRLLVDEAYRYSAKHSLLRNALALERYNEALSWARDLAKNYPTPEVEDFKNKLENYCNELEKSTQ